MFCLKFRRQTDDLAFVFHRLIDFCLIVCIKSGDHTFRLILENAVNQIQILNCGVGELAFRLIQADRQIQDIFRMVRDPLRVIGAVQEQGNDLRLRFGEFAARHLNQIIGQFQLPAVDLFLFPRKTLETFLIHVAGDEVLFRCD